MNAAELTAALRGKWNSETGQGSACCPAHEDTHPSLSVSDGDGDKVLVHCHKGCAQDAVIGALTAHGLWKRPEPLALILPRNGSHGTATIQTPTPIRKEVATYDYRDECGALLYQTVRFAPKDFRQRHPDGPGWAWGMGTAERVLYRLPELLSAPRTTPVYVVEGEKDVERLRALGLVATCNPLGAKKWQPGYTAALRGRPCILLPDNDVTGTEHVTQVAAALQGQAASVRIVPLPGLPEHGDVSDWLDAGHTRPELEALARDAPDTAPVAACPIKQIGESRIVAADVPPALVQGLLWSGKVHWLYSAPGAGKTMLLLAVAMHVAAGQPFGGRRVEPSAVLLIEEDSPESVLGEYVSTLGEIYPALPIDTLPFYYNAVQGLRLTDADGLEKIRAAVAACPIPPRLVIVDTCEKVLPSQDFTSRELAPLVTLCQELTARGIALVVIDHTRKAPHVSDKNKQQAVPSDDQLIDLLYGGRQKSGASDVMLYLTGSLTRGKLAGRFVKFRGAPPDPVTLTWAGDTGFSIVEPPRRAKTPSEEKALKWLSNDAPPTFTRRDLCAATGLTEPTAKRVLAEFVRRAWISQSGDGRSVQYAVNDIATPSILEL